MIPADSHLTNAIAKQRLTHALLFISEHKGSLLMHAKKLATMLLCTRHVHADMVDGGCERCSHCQRVWQNQHPNVRLVNSSEEHIGTDTQETEIKVDQIRELN